MKKHIQRYSLLVIVVGALAVVWVPILRDSITQPHITNLNESLPSVDKTPLKNQAWVIQLGSFNEKDNALKLIKQAQQLGFSAFGRGSSDKSQATIRVFVGPQLGKQQAMEVQNELQQKLAMKGMVMAYEPLWLDEDSYAIELD